MDNDQHNLERPITGRNRAQPFKGSELVLAVISHLKDTRGSTRDEIMDYIFQEYNSSIHQLKKSVNVALCRGVRNGVLRLENGHFFIEPPVDNNNLSIVARARGCGRRRRRRGCCPRKSRSRSQHRSRSRHRRSGYRSRRRRRSTRRGDRSRCSRRQGCRSKRSRRGC